MKKYSSFFLLSLVTIFMASCYKSPGTEITFDQEYVELDVATRSASNKLRTYNKVNDGLTVKDSIVINYAAKPKGSAINVTYVVSPITRSVTTPSNMDTVIAVAGTHYRITPGATGSVSVPAGSNFAKLPIEILDDNLTTGKFYIFNIKITASDVAISKYYGQVDYVFNAKCPFNIATFNGNYSALEPGYGTYAVTFSNVNATTVRNSNFWDEGIAVDYLFDVVAGTVVVVTKNGASSSSGVVNITARGNGTFNTCTGLMTVPYRVTVVSSGGQDNNTHTFTKL